MWRGWPELSIQRSIASGSGRSRRKNVHFIDKDRAVPLERAALLQPRMFHRTPDAMHRQKFVRPETSFVIDSAYEDPPYEKILQTLRLHPPAPPRGFQLLPDRRAASLSAFTGFSKPAAGTGSAAAKTKAGKAGKLGRSGMAAKETDRSNSRDGSGKVKAPEKSTAATGPAPRITEQRNILGQTVYTVSPSSFDVSPPLTELARIKVLGNGGGGGRARGTDVAALAHLAFQPTRPGNASGASAQLTERGPVATPPTTGFNFLG